MGSPSSTRILSFKFHFAIARGGIWEAQAAPTSRRRLSRYEAHNAAPSSFLTRADVVARASVRSFQ
jgi:hypothetical protein